MNAAADCGTWSSDEVPSSWVWSAFREVWDDATDSKKKLKQKEYLEKGPLAVVDQGETFVGGYTDNLNLKSEAQLPCVIFGDHSRAVKFIDFPFAQGADGVKVLVPTPALDPEFAYHALRCLELPDKGYSRHFKFLKASSFPVPPLAEQRRIVEKLDRLSARSRAAKNHLAHVQTLATRAKQATLAAAFRGKLTADWRAEQNETTANIFDLFETERRKKWEAGQINNASLKGRKLSGEAWKKKYAPGEPAGPLHYELPDTWMLLSVDQVSEFVTDGEHQTPKRTENGVPLLSARNIQNGYLDLSKIDHVPPAEFERISRRISVVGGDVLLSCSGSVGRTCVMPSGFICTFVRSVAIIRPLQECGTWISLALRTEDLQSQIKQRQKQTGQPNIFQGAIKKLEVPVAPAKERNEIVRRIEAAFARIDRMVEEASRAAKLLERLEAQLLANAFRGELVPQDPNDEPASALLARIREARANAPKPKRKRRS